MLCESQPCAGLSCSTALRVPTHPTEPQHKFPPAQLLPRVLAFPRQQGMCPQERSHLDQAVGRRYHSLLSTGISKFLLACARHSEVCIRLTLLKPVGILPLSTTTGFVSTAPKPDSAEISSTAGWALLCSPGWMKHHASLVSQTTLPPSIADFTPQPSGPSHHQQCPEGTLPCRSLSPPDSPELGLLDLVAARNVLENLIQLQGARATFTAYPSLNRDVLSKPQNTGVL